MGRLVLHFQGRLDEAAGRASGQLAALGGSGVAGAVAGALGKQAAASVPRPQIWKLVPVDSALVANLFGGGWAADRPPEGQAPTPGAGLPDGSFKAVIDDEDRKVNVQFDALDSGGLQGARLEAFLALVSDRRWDFLFEREDAGGQKTSRPDLAVHLKDWVDADTAQSSVTGLMEKPFEPGFGDENFAYDRGPDRYKAKNARFDSLDELFLVTGVSDAFISAFGDRLTVYLGQNSRMNVNADDPEELLRNARIMAGTGSHPALSDPTFAARLQKAVRELSQGGFLSISPYQFAQLLEQLGLAVNPSYLQATNTDQRGGFTDRSRVFRVRGVATVGAVEKSIEAVVTFDPDQAREQASQLGRLLHWREE
jgi:general secretion pathway protein K